MTEQNLRHGILFMVCATFIFATQDGISRHLASEYNVIMVMMLRYWGFAAFVTALTARQPGGLRAAVRCAYPVLQFLRGAVLVLATCIAVQGFVLLGLIETHALLMSTPLIVVALSGPILGERATPVIWAGVAAGFVGVLVILQPGMGVFAPAALLPLTAACCTAVYVILTRIVSRRDSQAISFFWTGMGGGITMTLAGIWFMEPMSAPDWGWMGVLCCTTIAGHWLMIRSYAAAPPNAIQPFTYLQLVFGIVIGIGVFHERPGLNVFAGAAVVVAAGLTTALLGRRRRP